jgi:hypothetical protein
MKYIFCQDSNGNSIREDTAIKTKQNSGKEKLVLGFML